MLATLPGRYVPSPHIDRARFRVRVGRTARDVVVDGPDCTIETVNGHRPDAEIKTDLATWSRMDAGELSGLEAFTQRKLIVRGSIEGALQFETLFVRSNAGGLDYEIQHIPVGRQKVCAFVAGDDRAEPLFLLHGLGGTKSSWLTVVPQLARRYRVYALDLPGFGSSSKPRGAYNAPWFADRVFQVWDVLGYKRGRVAGNSMGGRIAQEMAMKAPRRVQGIACLCPVTAFSYRPALRLVKLVRPELGILLGRLPRARLESELRGLFCDPNRIDAAWYEAAIDDFMTIWRSPRARMAFFASLRNIYLDEPYGENGFWTRLEQLKVPGLYVYGGKDVLISHRFAEKISKVLPSADVQKWSDCGHVPQLEFPDRTAETMLEFFERLGRARKGMVARTLRDKNGRARAAR